MTTLERKGRAKNEGDGVTYADDPSTAANAPDAVQDKGSKDK